MAISPDVVERARARVGMVLGNKYRLDRLLGIGGMAAVYAATHRNKKRVAVKMLHPELSIDDAVKTRFLREGYAANTVDHPGAVAVFDDDVTADGSAFLVMELLVGETLDARADRKGGTLPLAEVLPLADQLLDVLAAAHEKGLLHRDIKPDNLFLTASGQLKVLDFGIARLRELSSTDDKATGIGSFMGTPAFMSPEQARGRWDDVDLRSDVWAVGATIFNLLSGRSVHETDSVGEQLVMAATLPAPPLISVHAPGRAAGRRDRGSGAGIRQSRALAQRRRDANCAEASDRGHRACGRAHGAEDVAADHRRRSRRSHAGDRRCDLHSRRFSALSALRSVPGLTRRIDPEPGHQPHRERTGGDTPRAAAG